MKITSGPWHCVYTSDHAHDYRLTKPDGLPLAVSAEANDRSEQRANAKAIAALPELIQAGKRILAAKDRDEQHHAMVALEEALRKAGIEV